MLLEAAREWGVPPWQLGGGSKTSWLLYWLEAKKWQGLKAEQGPHGGEA